MGVFIYKTRGKFPKNFIMEAVDIYLMAEGSTAEVGYTATADLIIDLDKQGLLEDSKGNDYSRGLIHSHHNMGTSFSGTDFKELNKAADTLPYYLSVVVNNKMDFTAKVAIKSEEVYNGYSYYKGLNSKEIKTPKTFKRESFEVIDVELEFEWPDYMLEVDERIEKIQKYSPYSQASSSPGYHNSRYAGANWWEKIPETRVNPYSVAASRPVPVAEFLKQEEKQELSDIDLEILQEMYEEPLALIHKELEKHAYTMTPESFAKLFLRSCKDAKIPDEISIEYVLTTEFNNKKETWDDEMAEYFHMLISDPLTYSK